MIRKTYIINNYSSKNLSVVGNLIQDHIDMRDSEKTDFVGVQCVDTELLVERHNVIKYDLNTLEFDVYDCPKETGKPVKPGGN